MKCAKMILCAQLWAVLVFSGDITNLNNSGPGSFFYEMENGEGWNKTLVSGVTEEGALTIDGTAKYWALNSQNSLTVKTSNIQLELEMGINVGENLIAEIDGPIQGGGYINASGAGTLILNEIDLNKIFVGSSSVQLTSTSTSVNSIANSGGTIEFGMDDYTWNGTVSGIGIFKKTNSNSTLTIGSTQTMTGKIIVDEGTLSIPGSVERFESNMCVTVGSGAHFTTTTGQPICSLSGGGKVSGVAGKTIPIKSNTTSTTFSGELAGENDWNHTGPYSLTHTGTTTSTGVFTTSGTLYNNGDMSSLQQVTVNNGGVANGSGTFPSVSISSGGISGAGNSIGSNTAASLSIEAGGIRFNEYDSSQADKTIVTGNLVLDPGAIVKLVALPGTKTNLNDRYTILSVGGTRTGIFTSVVVDNANDLMKRNVSVLYTSNGVDILFGGRAPQKFDARMISLASTLSKQLEDYQGANIDDYLLMEVIDDFARNYDDACAYEPKARFRPFVVYDHRNGGYRSTEYGTPNHFRMDGLTTGMEFDLVKMFGFGVAYGYTNATISADNSWGKLDANSHSAIGFFRVGCLGAVNLDGRYNATWSWFDQERLGTDGSRPKANYMGVEQGVELRSIYTARFKTVNFFPIVSLRYVNFSVDPYVETGNIDEKMWVKKDSANQLYTDVGLNITRPIAVGPTVKITPLMGVYWTHQYLNDDRTVLAALDQNFTYSTQVDVENTERNAGKVNLGVDISNGTCVSGFINFDTLFSGTSRFTWDTRAGLKAAF